jgi:DNA-binding transcriptional LysR family regulator
LTKSLFQIEREVGQRLFDRHGQTVAPTVFGALVPDSARKIVVAQQSVTRATARPPTSMGVSCRSAPAPTPPTSG